MPIVGAGERVVQPVELQVRCGDGAEQVDHLYREESGKILAGLIRRSGSFDLAEEALHDEGSFYSSKDRDLPGVEQHRQEPDEEKQ